MTRSAIYLHIRALKLKPLGVARPAIYPEDAADRILRRLGFQQSNRKAKGGRYD